MSSQSIFRPTVNSRLLWGYATIGALAVVPQAFVISGALEVNETPTFVSLGLTLFMLAVLLRPLYLVATRHPEPSRQLVQDFREGWPRLLLAGGMALAMTVGLQTSSMLKKQIPAVQSFYADPFLADLDRFLFFGVDPWRVTHAIIPDWGTAFIDVAYGVWLMIQIALTIWICFTADRKAQVRVGVSFLLCWFILGNLLATALSSVGPCFYEHFYGDPRFGPLMDNLDPAPAARAQMAYLLANQGTDAVAAGISAMPSLHVAICVLIGLVFRDRWPRFQWAAWTFAAVIYVGSIHLGWHYATDGIVGGLGALLIWKASAWFVRPTQSRNRSGHSPEASALPQR